MRRAASSHSLTACALSGLVPQPRRCIWPAGGRNPDGGQREGEESWSSDKRIGAGTAFVHPLLMHHNHLSAARDECSTKRTQVEVGIAQAAPLARTTTAHGLARGNSLLQVPACGTVVPGQAVGACKWRHQCKYRI